MKKEDAVEWAAVNKGHGKAWNGKAISGHVGKDGGPRYVAVYDNGGKTLDRYTVVFTRYFSAGGPQWRGRVCYVTTSGNPAGFYQHGEAWAWEFSAGGKRVTWDKLPVAAQRCVLDEYEELWQMQFVQDADDRIVGWAADKRGKNGHD